MVVNFGKNNDCPAERRNQGGQTSTYPPMLNAQPSVLRGRGKEAKEGQRTGVAAEDGGGLTKNRRAGGRGQTRKDTGAGGKNGGLFPIQKNS